MSTATKVGVALGSHQFLDAFALAYHRVVAERLRTAPDQTLQHARNNLAAWITQGDLSVNALLALREWESLLNQPNMAQLMAILTEESDEGQRLRQSTPFAGVLPAEERLRILAECEKGAGPKTG